MLNKELTCIICPNGCQIKVELDKNNDIVNICGNLCNRGIPYARQEIITPMRNIATSVLVENGEFPLVSVRLNNEIPKEYVFQVIKLINQKKLVAPIFINDVIIKNIMGLGVDVIATKNIAVHKKIHNDRIFC